MRNDGQMFPIREEGASRVREGYPNGKQQAGKGLVDDSIMLTCSWLLQHNYFDLDTNATRYGGITWNNLSDRPIYTLNFEVCHETPD